jgi:hypothetical protein
LRGWGCDCGGGAEVVRRELWRRERTDQGVYGSFSGPEGLKVDMVVVIYVLRFRCALL